MADMRLIAPVVTDADRLWAIDQKPEWWDRNASKRAKRQSPGAPSPLAWEEHVADQAERFEGHESHVSDRKTQAEWSGLWRRVWWPKADPRKRFPDSTPYEHEGEKHPFVRRGDPRFATALRLATPSERLMWERFGVAQFTPGDPRVNAIMGGERHE